MPPAVRAPTTNTTRGAGDRETSVRGIRLSDTESGATEEMYVPDENIELRRVTFRRENIHSILKGKVHEKN